MHLRAIHENCSGCRACRLACSLENFREVHPARATVRIQGRFPAPGDYRIHLCTQCGACAEVCPVGAIAPSDGVYLVDAELCTGCLSCVEACPHGVMVAHRASEVPAKCTLCGACAALCPRGAIVLDGE
ncbi:MAG: 4Fe-4S binding protein [Deferrisomatales bacterium]